MPATQRGQVYQLAHKGGPKKFGIRYYGPDGQRRKQSPFATKKAAYEWFRTHVEPQLRGEVVVRADVTFSEFVVEYLERHGANVRPRTIATLTERLGHAEKRFGNVPLREFERMVDEISRWQFRQPGGCRYGRMAALRQTLGAAVRWGYMTTNPAKLTGPNRQPEARTVRPFTNGELEAITAKLSAVYQPLPMFAAATGLRPEEWQALERKDIDRNAGVINVRRTVSSGEVVELGKTSRSRRQVPLSPNALAALDALLPRLDTPLLFPSPEGSLLHLDNFRYREWTPAISAAGIPTPARIYDLRSTFASNALAAGITAFELARIMGTSAEMIERHYGTLVGGAGAGIASRLAIYEAKQDRAAEAGH